MKRLSLMLLALTVTIGCGERTTPKWEYLLVSPSDEELPGRLKSLGADGWEIVFARRATSSGEGSSRATASYEMILKRPLSQKAAEDILSAPPTPK